MATRGETAGNQSPTTPARGAHMDSTASGTRERRSPAIAAGCARTTRSSAAASSTADPPPPSQTLNHPLLSSDAPITLKTLLSDLPGRRSQILEILRLVGPPESPMPPLLLYGGPSTGKTAAVLRIFKHLNRPFVYTSCRSCYSPRILFESVLDQLLHHRKAASNRYSSSDRCERGSDFIDLLRVALCKALDGKKRGSKEPVTCGDGNMIYLVFDNVELIRSWEKSSVIISLLFKMHDILRIPEVGLIFISSSTPDAYYSSAGSVEPLAVYFPDYTADDLHSILMKNRDNQDLYLSFLSVVLKPFIRVTRRVDELSNALEPLYQKYCEPLAELSVVPDEKMRRRLFEYIQPHLSTLLNETFWSSSRSSHGASKKLSRSSKWSIRNPSCKDASNDLEFHMSVSAKYLLLSAFLASRNPATLDASLFDSTGGSNDRKRKRKSSHMSIEQKENTAQEILMKGPGSFPLERVLAIFQCITSVAEGALEEESLEDGLKAEAGNIGLMSDVLLQLSTLCNANFMCKSRSCPLEGSTRYRSCIDEEMALKVARSVNFPLSKYLYRR